jgi:hypothetical protein
VNRPDYEHARQQAGFRWSVGATQAALRELAGIPIKEFNLNPDACIEAYRRGQPMLDEMFPEVVAPVPLATPAVSYGHVNGLGSELIFPEGGEVAHTHIYSSLEEGIAALKEPVDFATAGMAPFFLDFLEKLQAAFPGQKVGFSYGLEGPVTTAWELRGEGFFTDIFDQPERTKEFLGLVVDSIAEFHRFRCRVSGTEPINPNGAGMCDDIASNIPPYLFSEMVVPAWDGFYRAMTTGRRRAHVEDLRPAQLPYLEEVGLSYFDPSISHRLNPRIIWDCCRVPFGWRLGSFHYLSMSADDVRDFVFQAAADGACAVFTYIEGLLVHEPQRSKVYAFIEAAQEVEQALDEGATRADLAAMVSDAGKAKFWDHWLE